MISFRVNDMSCGHCVSAVTQAVRDADPAATVTVNLAEKRVEIEPVVASAEDLVEALREAGYTPLPWAA